MSYIMILIGCVFVNNVVLSQFMGICPFLGVSKQIKSSVGMGGAVVFVMLCATAITYPVYKLLEKFEITYLKTVAFILVIAMFVQLVEIVMKKLMPPLYKALGVYLPLITTNCAVLGIALTNVQNYSLNETFNIAQKLGASVVSGLGTAIGFTIAIVIMAGIRERIEYNDVPESFKGMPIVLLTAGLMAIAFFGFSGII